MDKNLKIPLWILFGGYISSLGYYFIRYYYFFYRKPYRDDYFLIIVAVVSAVTAVYLFTLLLIRYIKLFKNVWTSFFLVLIITLSIFFLTPFSYYESYYKFYDNKLNLKRDKTIKTKDKTEPERKILAANKKEIKQQPEETKEKIQTESKRIEEIESKLNDGLEITDAAIKPIAELQAKLESERKENAKLIKKLNKTIKKTKSLEKVRKIKENVFVQAKSNKTFYKIKLNSDVDNTDSDIKNQEVIFKVQIISSSTRLATNSPKLKGLKNVWEYKDGGFYKYTVGNKRDLQSASVLQSELRERGFKDAFVVAFQNEKRIPVRKALKFLK